MAGLVWVPSAARAEVGGGGGDVPNGYSVSVSLHFYGRGVKGGDVTHSVTVHPSCYWSPASGNYTDAAAMLAWYDSVTGGLQTVEVLSEYGPRSVWEAAAQTEANGGDVSWYRAYCQDPADYSKFGIGGADGSTPIFGNPQGFNVFTFRAFNAGAAIPAPLVSPAELARAAYNEMTIPEPATGRNPMITKVGGAPTLVGLPTWFWVDDPLAVGDAQGTLDVTAEIQPAGGRVWATVVAATTGLNIAAHPVDYGSGHCDPASALVHYAPGVDESTACTVIFKHASTGHPAGMDVTASTDWNATWTGSGGTGGNLDPLHQEITTQVAVAEIQNIVTR
jgi:hypothetical protein